MDLAPMRMSAAMSSVASGGVADVLAMSCSSRLATSLNSALLSLSAVWYLSLSSLSLTLASSYCGEGSGEGRVRWRSVFGGADLTEVVAGGGEACPRFAAHLRLALLELGMLGILARGHRQKGGEHRDGQQSCAHHRCVVVCVHAG